MEWDSHDSSPRRITSTIIRWRVAGHGYDPRSRRILSYVTAKYLFSRRATGSSTVYVMYERSVNTKRSVVRQDEMVPRERVSMIAAGLVT